MMETDFALLNRLYDPKIQSTDSKRYITLTTHNNKADSINQSALQRLTDPTFSFQATIAGEFPDKSFPTDLNLCLRKGAQVMFVKNETGELKRYFNGKLAVVTNITEDKIVVELADSNVKMELEKERLTGKFQLSLVNTQVALTGPNKNRHSKICACPDELISDGRFPSWFVFP